MTTLISNSFESLGWLNINDKSEVNDAVMVHNSCKDEHFFLF